MCTALVRHARATPAPRRGSSLPYSLLSLPSRWTYGVIISFLQLKVMLKQSVCAARLSNTPLESLRCAKERLYERLHSHRDQTLPMRCGVGQETRSSSIAAQQIPVCRYLYNPSKHNNLSVQQFYCPVQVEITSKPHF